MIHPSDTKSANPRLQCAVCAKWKRLYDRDDEQLFFGGCEHNDGNDHVCSQGEVCNECCDRECIKKNPAAVALGSLGGKARKKALSKERATEIAKKAVAAREAKKHS